MVEFAVRYVPICVYLAYYYNMMNELSYLIDYMKANLAGFSVFDVAKLVDDGRYLFELLRTILVLDEYDVHLHLLSRMSSVTVLINEDVIQLYEQNARHSFLYVLFRIFESMLDPLKSRTPADQVLESEEKDDGTKITRKKLVLVIRKFFICCEDEEVLMKLLRKVFGGHLALMIEVLLDSEEEERLIKIFDRNEDLLLELDAQTLIRRKLFKLLVLFDRAKLIDLFNSPFKNEEETTTTVYKELCERIALRRDIEGLTYVILQVHSTFWDMEKLPLFHKALSTVFNNDEGSLNNREEMVSRTQGVLNSKSSWVVHVQNPLLFCIKLVDFFNKMERQLDYKNRDILDLKKSVLAFCISYTQNASEDVLMVNVFDRDCKGKDYMEYMFDVQDMSLLETEFIGGLIYQMWDLGRHTMQTISQFMRLGFMTEELDEFSWKFLTKKYEMPIEQNDTFQLEFAFTSNSVYLRVLCEILWPLLLVIVEFLFSLELIDMYKQGAFDEHWISTYWQDHPRRAWLHLYLRGNYILSNLIKSVLFRMFAREGFYHQYFYNTLNLLFILQMAVCPFVLPAGFWVLCNLQMLVVMTIVAYCFYNSLSLPQIGVILRIFFRMVYVVLIFGTISCFIMMLVAYPIHSSLIDFSQVVDGQLFPEMNVFRSLYNGVLTLFEFVFGAVIFFRPYLQENPYTYAVSFVMVIFSFFGNIMMANILIAFLTRQFVEITRNANYYTNRMQFGLVKIFNMRDLDGIFVVPYPFVVLLLPLYLCMLKAGPTRKAVNGFLRRFIHVVNVFLPAFLLLNLQELLLLAVRYCEVFISIMIRIPLRLANLFYLLVWSLGGFYLLLKLYLLDLGTMVRVMLDFKTLGDDLLNPNLYQQTKNNLIVIFRRFEQKAKEYLKDNEDEPVVTIGHFISLLGLQGVGKKVQYRVAVEKADEDEALKEDELFEEEKTFIGFSRKFNAKYSKEEPKLIVGLLRRFCIEEANTEEEQANLKLDLELMVEKLQNNLTIDRVQYLIGFDLSVLHRANKLINSNENTNVKEELSKLINKIRSMDIYLNRVVLELENFSIEIT